MIMIVSHHILYHGGILENVIPFTGTYKAAWLLDIATACAVDIYGLISGYVGYETKHGIKRILRLYLQVIFYTLTATVLFWIIRPELVDWIVIRNAVFPFAYRTYWYYTAYFCLSFIMPFLDELTAALDRRKNRQLLLALFVVTSVLTTVFGRDFAYTDRGYTFLWLAILYLAGAYIKKYDGEKKGERRHLAGYLLCTVFTWLTKMGVEQVIYSVEHTYRKFSLLMEYISPFIVISAVCLVVAFKEMKCGDRLRKMASFWAPTSFDVYLLHDEPLVRDTFIIGAFAVWLAWNPALMVLAVIGTAVGIFLIGSLAGRLRILIFRLLRVERFCEWVEERTAVLFQRM